MKINDTIASVLKGKINHRILAIAPEQTVYEAIQLMAEHDVGALLVVSSERLVGVFTERDYARKCVLLGHASKDTQVQEIMSTPVQSVTLQHTVDDCMTLMTQQRVRHLPVLREEKILGIISIGDLVKWVMSGQEQTIEALHGYIAGAYPA